MIRFDNYRVDVIGEHREQFDLAMKLAFAGRESATHWAFTKAGSMVFFSDEPPKVGFIVKSGEFPMGVDVGAATEFAWAWLKNPSRYGPTGKAIVYNAKNASRPPDHDGDNHAGWRVSTTDDSDMSGDSDRAAYATLSGSSKDLSKLPTVQIDPHGNHGIWAAPCGLYSAIVAVRPWWAMYGK